ncbi:MAG: hypothetical protein AAFV53_35985 [Myxococcota bacterium]
MRTLLLFSLVFSGCGRDESSSDGPDVSCWWRLFIGQVDECIPDREPVIEADGVPLEDPDTFSPVPTLRVSWGPDSVILDIYDSPPEAQYYVGLTETAACEEDTCWTGEDCFLGFGEYFYCHPAGRTGVELLYNGDFDNLLEGAETVFPDDRFQNNVTIYVEDATYGLCFVGGHDPSYYDGMGCTVVELY